MNYLSTKKQIDERFSTLSWKVSRSKCVSIFYETHKSNRAIMDVCIGDDVDDETVRDLVHANQIAKKLVGDVANGRKVVDHGTWKRKPSILSKDEFKDKVGMTFEDWERSQK